MQSDFFLGVMAAPNPERFSPILLKIIDKIPRDDIFAQISLWDTSESGSIAEVRQKQREAIAEVLESSKSDIVIASAMHSAPAFRYLMSQIPKSELQAILNQPSVVGYPPLQGRLASPQYDLDAQGLAKFEEQISLMLDVGVDVLSPYAYDPSSITPELFRNKRAASVLPPVIAAQWLSPELFQRIYAMDPNLNRPIFVQIDNNTNKTATYNMVDMLFFDLRIFSDRPAFQNQLKNVAFAFEHGVPITAMDSIEDSLFYRFFRMADHKELLEIPNVKDFCRTLFKSLTPEQLSIIDSERSYIERLLDLK